MVNLLFWTIVDWKGTVIRYNRMVNDPHTDKTRIFYRLPEANIYLKNYQYFKWATSYQAEVDKKNEKQVKNKFMTNEEANRLIDRYNSEKTLFLIYKLNYLIMKKFLFVFVLALALTSCYNNRIMVGNVQPNDPVVEVQTQWNSHWIYGLVPGEKTNMKAEDFLKGRTNYVIKTNMSFVNGLIGGLTCGIYCPTTTTFYVPLNEVK